MLNRIFIKKIFVFLVMAVSSPSVFSDHSWGPYHWARTTTSFDLTVINSTTNDWDGYVSYSVADWSDSSKLNMVENVNGSTEKSVRRRCNADSGTVRICNLAYGQNGWLGIAGISVDSNGHITKGYTKLNDTYFAMDFYNNSDWKQSVVCQELGHNIGLGHQDEDFNNGSLFSCMDYQNPPYKFPNAHDYDQLVTIYGHTDTYDSYATASTGGGGSSDDGVCNAPPGKGCNKGKINGNNGDIGWGMSLGRRRNHETFIRIDHDGTRHLTDVIWIEGY